MNIMDSDQKKDTQKERVQNNETKNTFSVLGIAWELGYIIAIPLVVLTIGGKILDEKLGTSPLLLLVGVVLAIVLSTYAIYKKMVDIINNTK